MPADERVTIGVPVYRGERFLKESLRSVQAQTHRALDVVVAFDGPEPATEALVRPFLDDPRFRVLVRPERLGWVGNINALMAATETPFWVYHQQDDVIDARYVETLVAHARRHPDAAVVYCDMEAFGAQTWTMAQPSVTGSPVGRLLALFADHHPAVAFRGLTRVEALRASGGIRPNDADSFSADTTWMASVARWGSLIRVPEVLYHKRYHDANEHGKWARWPAEERARPWTVHCADLLEQPMLVDAAVPERRLLWLALVVRLTAARTAGHYVDVGALTLAARAAMLDSLFALAHARGADVAGWLEDDAARVRLWTEAFYAPGARTWAAETGVLARKLATPAFWRRRLGL